MPTTPNGPASSLFVLASFVVACSAKVAHLPKPGESLMADGFVVEPGGKGFNLAVGARRLGARVDGLVAIGTDFFSQLARSALDCADLSAVKVVTYDTTTGSGIGFTNAEGENCLAVCPGANARLCAADVRSAAAALQEAGLVLAQFEVGDEPILEAFRVAQEAGRRTLLNPSPLRPLRPELLARTSVLVLNRVEAVHLAAEFGNGLAASAGRFDALAATLLTKGPEAVVITLGADGAVLHRHGFTPVHQPAFRVEAIDTLGAGDAFTAGLAASLAEGSDWPEALRNGAACGAIVAQTRGVFDALPDRHRMEGFLASAV